jgi:PAS domain S-box-containing protein
VETPINESRLPFLDLVRIMQVIADGIVVVDSNGVIRFVNPAGGRIFDREPEDLLGRLFGFPVVSGDATEIEIMQRGRRIITAEMRVSDISWQGEPCFLAAIRDITIRKEAERRLSRELETTSALAEMSVRFLNTPTDFIAHARIVLEKSAQLTESKHGYVGEVEVGTGDLVSHTLSDMLGPECLLKGTELARFPCGPDGVYSGLWGVSLNEKKPFFTNSPADHPAAKGLPAGHIPLRRFLSFPVIACDELVGQISLANSTRDYTDEDLHAVGRLADYFALCVQRNRVEDALRKSEERFVQLAENVDDVFWVTETGPPERVSYVSRAYEVIWGRSREEALRYPRAWADVVVAEDRDGTLASFDAFLNKGQDWSAEYRVARPDGTIRWVLDRKFAIRDSHGRIRRAVGLSHDITRRKADEERQEQLVEEIKRLAYIVSHDFRAPLLNLRGFSDELESSFADVRDAWGDIGAGAAEKTVKAKTALDEDIPEALRYIKTSVSRLDHLVASLLKLSRLERSELELQRLDMNSVVEDTLQSLRHQIEAKQIRVSVTELPYVIADLTSVEQIMGNLLDNAIKYMASDRPGEISVAGWRTTGETVFQVSDNGLGIDEGEQHKVFELFHRSGGRDVPGDGMGLAYVRTLVRRHGGRIWCDSRPGKGSTFAFTIPFQSGPRRGST